MKNETLHYSDQGPKDAAPLVLLHAFPLNHTMWAPQIPVLSKTHRVIAYDIRGHGESHVGDGHYTLELFVDDLIALMDQLKIEKTTLCGLSMGGYIALRALERHPERFSALVLADTRSAADSNEAKLKRAAAIKLIKEKGVSVFAEGFLKAALAPETALANPHLVQIVKEMIVKNAPAGISGALLAMAARTDTTASLSLLKIPTLILVGEKDQVTPPADSLAMQEKIPNARMRVIPDAGHLSNLENPESFNQVLQHFLSEIPPRSQGNS